MSERPTCECHGEPTYWHKDVRCKAGGFWSCLVKQRAVNAQYRLSDKGRATKRVAQRRRQGANVPLDAPPLSPYEAGRRGGLARGNQILDEAIARYEEELQQLTTPHQEVAWMTH